MKELWVLIAVVAVPVTGIVGLTIIGAIEAWRKSTCNCRDDHDDKSA